MRSRFGMVVFLATTPFATQLPPDSCRRPHLFLLLEQLFEELEHLVLECLRPPLARLLDTVDVPIPPLDVEHERPRSASDVAHHDRGQQEPGGPPIPLLKGMDPYQLHVSPNRQARSRGCVLRPGPSCGLSGQITAEPQHLLSNITVLRREISGRRERIDIRDPVLPRYVGPRTREDQPVELQDIGEFDRSSEFGQLLRVLEREPVAPIDLSLVALLLFGSASKGQEP